MLRCDLELFPELNIFSILTKLYEGMKRCHPPPSQIWCCQKRFQESSCQRPTPYTSLLKKKTRSDGKSYKIMLTYLCQGLDGGSWLVDCGYHNPPKRFGAKIYFCGSWIDPFIFDLRERILCCQYSELLVMVTRAHLLQDFTPLLLITRSLPCPDAKVESGQPSDENIGRVSIFLFFLNMTCETYFGCFTIL